MSEKSTFIPLFQQLCILGRVPIIENYRREERDGGEKRSIKQIKQQKSQSELCLNYPILSDEIVREPAESHRTTPNDCQGSFGS